jgi:acyl-CoA synthetase (AMP-forming)/AMP-acid ligase II
MANLTQLLAGQGFPAGGRAGLMLANVPEMCVLCYGILRAGGIVVPMNPLLKARDSPGEPAEGAAATSAEFIPSGADDLGGLLSAHPPVPGVAARADEDTAVILCTSGTTGRPNVMKGYWGRPEATREAIPDGWLRTGDLARQDADGYFYLVDRKKDLIIRGGFNVYPREIEEALYEHPAVAEVAVVGMPHPTLGEEIGAVVTLKPGASASADELRAFARDRLAAYKYPRAVRLVEALPKGPTGKILRREVDPPAGQAPPGVPPAGRQR